MRKFGLSIASFLILLLAIPAFAQKISGTLRGEVTDPTGAVISGAKVTVTNEAHGVDPVFHHNLVRHLHLRRAADRQLSASRSSSQGFKSEVRSKVILERRRRPRSRHPAPDRRRSARWSTSRSPAVAVKTVGADVSGLVTGDGSRGSSR